MPRDQDISAGYGGYGGGGFAGNPRGEPSGFSGGGYNTVAGGGDRGGILGGGMTMADIQGLLDQYMRANTPGTGDFPFMFGMPPSQMTPNFMPQIAPPNQGNPQNLNDLYAMYGAAPNAPMPSAPPSVPPQPPPQAPTQLPPQALPAMPIAPRVRPNIGRLFNG